MVNRPVEGTKTERWLIDSRASVHVTNNKQWLINPKATTESVTVGNGQEVCATLKGDIILKNKHGSGVIQLKDILYIEDFYKKHHECVETYEERDNNAVVRG